VAFDRFLSHRGLLFLRSCEHRSKYLNLLKDLYVDISVVELTENLYENISTKLKNRKT